MREKIRVLVLAADPSGAGERLRLDEEVRAIDHAIRGGTARDYLELVPHLATRRGDLQDALMRYEPQVVHFAGHGGSPGVIYLGDEHGRGRPVGKEALGRLFGIRRDAVRVVVLNGCDTLATAEVLSEVVDYAIGMKGPICDESAAVFAAAFYGALAMGVTPAEAFERGVAELELADDPDSKLPVLRVRAGVDTRVALVARPPSAGGDAVVPGAKAVFENRAGGRGREDELQSFDAGGMTFRNGG